MSGEQSTVDEQISETVNEVLDSVSDEYDVDEDSVEELVTQFIDEYGVPQDSARRSVMRSLAKERDIDVPELTGSGGGGSGGVTSVSNLDSSDENPWYTVKATAVNLGQPDDSEQVRQYGYLDDGEDRIRFVMWASGTDEDMVLEEGETYELESVVVNYSDYNEADELHINKSSNVSEADSYIEPSDTTTEFTGAIVDTAGESGLVKRDAESGEVVDSGHNGPTEKDLRLILSVDNGYDSVKVTFNKELTEQITGISFEEAEEIAADALDLEAVIGEMLPELLGRYVTVRGEMMGQYLLTEEFEWPEANVDADELLVKARTLDNEGGDN